MFVPLTFAELGVRPAIAESLRSRGFDQPFDIQAATLPDALAGHDICGRAPTGSGKTIAFGIPMIERVADAKPKRPTGLVLSPTRELADQISAELEPLAHVAKRRVLSVYGGVNIKPQIAELARGVDVLVACPGRLLDLIGQQAVVLDDVGLVVVDEADRMADMGFLPDVRRILDMTRSDRQTLLFSATLDGDIAELTKRYQKHPKRHEVGEVTPDIHAMTHHFWRVERPDRVATSVEVIRRAGRTVVFTRTRHGADRVAKQLNRGGVEAVPIHGGRSQNQRNRALASFTDGEALALVATDVAARGIHVDDVTCVIHFDPPEDDKTYLHRSGRTARAGASGVVVSLIEPDSTKAAKVLLRQLGLDQVVEEPDLDALDHTAPPANQRVRTRTLPTAANPQGRRNNTSGQRKQQTGGRSGAKPSGKKPGSPQGSNKQGGTKPGAKKQGGNKQGAKKRAAAAQASRKRRSRRGGR